MLMLPILAIVIEPDVFSTAWGTSARVLISFFFQAEDGIRDLTVTGVQTCALPISWLQEHKIPSVWKPGEFSRQSFLDQISQGEVYIALVDDLTVGTFILQWTDSLDRKSVV